MLYWHRRKVLIDGYQYELYKIKAKVDEKIAVSLKKVEPKITT